MKREELINMLVKNAGVGGSAAATLEAVDKYVKFISVDFAKWIAFSEIELDCWNPNIVKNDEEGTTTNDLFDRYFKKP